MWRSCDAEQQYEYRKSSIGSYGISSRVSFIDLYLYSEFCSYRNNFLWMDGRRYIRMDNDPSFRLTSGLYLKCVQMTLHSLPVSTVLSSNQSMLVAKKVWGTLSEDCRLRVPVGEYQIESRMQALLHWYARTQLTRVALHESDEFDYLVLNENVAYEL